MWLASWAGITIRIDEDDVRGDASCDAPKIRTVRKSGINKQTANVCAIKNAHSFRDANGVSV
jgi:hypothetical protein